MGVLIPFSHLTEPVLTAPMLTGHCNTAMEAIIAITNVELPIFTQMFYGSYHALSEVCPEKVGMKYALLSVVMLRVYGKNPSYPAQTWGRALQILNEVVATCTCLSECCSSSCEGAPVELNMVRNSAISGAKEAKIYAGINPQNKLVEIGGATVGEFLPILTPQGDAADFLTASVHFIHCSTQTASVYISERLDRSW